MGGAGATASMPLAKSLRMTAQRILIVDDDARISTLLQTFLIKMGRYEVRTENRSFAALATAREFRPDLVLLDVDMPGKDGGDVAAELAADSRFAATPVLFVTSLVSRQEGRAESLTRGGQQFLSKPVDPQALLAAVRRLLAPVAAVRRLLAPVAAESV